MKNLKEKIYQFLQKINFCIFEKHKYVKPNQVVTPFIVIVKNTKDKPLNFVLFGKNKFNHTNNYGSDIGVEVNAAHDIEYIHLLEQSSSQPFETSLIRVQSANSSQVTKELIFKDE